MLNNNKVFNSCMDQDVAKVNNIKMKFINQNKFQITL